uniref:Coiled-coil domain containing 81 n=1 Tax=Lepisosteus oculatus TaxID=7918 RepID=W5MTM8_LEPOC
MTDILLSVVSDGERSLFPTLSKLSENDVEGVWTNVSAFVERQMSLQKGVHIPGLGTFTFSQQRHDVGNKVLLNQRPVFLLSEKLSQTHGLKHTKPLAAGDVPVVPLNFTALSLESPFDRDTVEGCVRETLLVLSRALACRRRVLFTFRGVGALSIREGRAKMRFYRDFLDALDPSGGLVGALTLSPGTADTCISLSKRVQAEVKGPNSARSHVGSDCKVWLLRSSEEAYFIVCAEGLGRRCAGGDSWETFLRASDPQVARQPVARPTLAPARVNGVSIPEELERNLGPGALPQRQGHTEPAPAPARRETGCHVAQELCYLCMQRAQRNVPVNLTEERRRQEQEEERLLLLYQQQTQQQELKKQQAQLQATREHNQKLAAFNRRVSEAIKERKTARPTAFHASYIFQSRPLTPPRWPKQQLYLQELCAQASQKRDREAQSRLDQDFMDRLQQLQLAEDLAIQKEELLKKKAEQTQNYQKALDVQVKTNKTGAHMPLLPNLLKHSFSLKQVDLERQRTQAYLKCLVHLIPEFPTVKQSRLQSALLILQIHHQMTWLCQSDIMLCKAETARSVRRLNRYAQQNWDCSFSDGQAHIISSQVTPGSGSQLLMDQCEKYRRCFQCKRRTTNCGESNIWKDTRYIPGSRLMV